MADRVLVAPPGITRPDQFAERNTQRMSQPMMGSRPSLIVGGPAYFTPEGYQAPIQPEQSFMPTGGRPNLIQDSFNRQLPPIQRPQPQMPAPTPAPVQAPAPTQTGGVGDPAPYVPPVPTPTPAPAPAPSQGPDRGSAGSAGPAPQEDTPNFLAFQQTPEYQDWVNSGGIGTMDMYTASDGRRFGSGTAGRMYERYLASLGQEDSNTSAPAPVSAPEPEFVPPPTMPEPNGFFPGVTPDFSNLDFSGLSDLSLEDMDFSNLPGMMPPPVSPPAAATMPAPAQAPAPVYTPPPSQVPMQDMMDDYDFGNPNLRNMRGFDPRR